MQEIYVGIHVTHVTVVCLLVALSMVASSSQIVGDCGCRIAVTRERLSNIYIQIDFASFSVFSRLAMIVRRILNDH